VTTDRAVVVDGTTLTPTGVGWAVTGLPDVVVDPTGIEAAVSSSDGRVERRDVRSGALVGAPISVAPGSFYGFGPPLAYLPDGSLLVADGPFVHRYLPGSDAAVQTIEAANDIALMLPMADGARVLISEDGTKADATSYLLTVADGTLTPVLGGWVNTAAISRDGATLLAQVARGPGGAGDVELIDATTFQTTAPVTPSPELIGSAVQLDTGEWLMAGSAGLTLAAADGAVVSSVQQSSAGSPTMALTDGRSLGRSGSRLAVVDVGMHNALLTDTAFDGQVAANASGTTMVLARPDGAWPIDPSTGAQTGPSLPGLAGHTSLSITVSADGLMVAGDEGTGVIVRSIETGEALSPPLPALSYAPTIFAVVAFSNDNTRLAIAEPGGVGIYDTTTFDAVSHVPIQTQFGLSLAWSPDDTTLLFSDITSGGHTIDVATNEVSPLNGIYASYGADGDVVLSTSAPIAIIDVATGEQTLFEGSTEFGAGYFLGSDRLLRGTTSGYWYLLDIATGSRIGSPLEDPGLDLDTLGTRPVIAADGTWAIVSITGGPALRFELDPERWAELACEAAGRNLTESEWNRYLGSIGPYRPTCA
jgi:hypothetical protein